MKLKKYVALFGALALVSGSASAAVITAPLASPTGTVDIIAMETSVNFDYRAMSSNVVDNADGTSTFMGNNNLAGVWNYDWNISADADPFIDATLTFLNMTGSTQTFAVALNLPVSPPFSPGLKSGNLGYSFSDTNNDGSASVSNVNWTGLIDGGSAMSLFASSLSCGGVGCSLSLAPVSDGPLPHAAGVGTDIGILLDFALSAGDTVTFNTRFEVTPVPVPAAVWLFGSGLLGLVGVARRRKA